MNSTKGVITVGTTGGKVLILSGDDLTKQDQLKHEQVDQPIMHNSNCYFINMLFH